jgi:ferrochelatase
MATGSSSADRPPYAVLLVAYGSPGTLDDVAPYLHDVRGRPAPPELVEELRHRYAAIGGRSPLLPRTEDQAHALSTALGGVPVYVGMRHWHPYIADALARIRAAGHRRIVALALAPHFSRMSIGAYERQIEVARNGIAVTMVREWFDHPGFLDAVAAVVEEGLARFGRGSRERVALVFTAHSLPRRILDLGDPYADQLQASMSGVLTRLGLTRATFAYQSAGRSTGAWLGPDAAEVVEDLAREGAREVLLCPIGFVSDHLEVLYDVDIELRERARRLGVRLERTRSLNDDPVLIAALADLVRSAARGEGWT